MTKEEKVIQIFTATSGACGKGDIGAIEILYDYFFNTFSQAASIGGMEPFGPAQKTILHKIVMAHMPRLIERIAVVYCELFTDEELDDLVAFYTSPLGKKMIMSSTSLMTTQQELGQAWGMEVVQIAMKDGIFNESGETIPDLIPAQTH